jgi:hypothetical protein
VTPLPRELKNVGSYLFGDSVRDAENQPSVDARAPLRGGNPGSAHSPFNGTAVELTLKNVDGELYVAPTAINQVLATREKRKAKVPLRTCALPKLGIRHVRVYTVNGSLATVWSGSFSRAMERSVLGGLGPYHILKRRGWVKSRTVRGMRRDSPRPPLSKEGERVRDGS